MEPSTGLVLHEVEEDRHVIRVISAVDIYAAPQFASEVTAASDAPLILIDLTSCRYMDSRGVDVLLRAHREYGQRFRVITRPESGVDRLLRALKFDRHVAMFGSVDEARRSNV
jgi:anti-anti-sigma factor